MGTATAAHKKGSQLELAPKNQNPITKKEVKIMSTTIASAPNSNLYGTCADTELQRHHWQNLAGFIVSIRPDWSVAAVADTLYRCRNLKTFDELTRISIRVAGSYRRFKTPNSIGMVAAGLVEL